MMKRALMVKVKMEVIIMMMTVFVVIDGDKDSGCYNNVATGADCHNVYGGIDNGEAD